MTTAIAMTLPHSTPEEWAIKHKEMELSAVVFPVDYKAPLSLIDEYVCAAKNAGLIIAEVGSWCNPLDKSNSKRERNMDYCVKQLELADYVKACCAVNISGTDGEIWDGSYASNYTDETYEKIVLSIQNIIDRTNPTYTKYTIEPMPHMIPDSPESYLSLIKDVDRQHFGVHLDVVNMITSPRIYFDNRSLSQRCFDLLGPHICSCHVKDAVLEHSLTVSIKEVPCGQGGFDIGFYLEKIKEYNLPVVIEHLNEEQSYRDAVKYIKSLIDMEENK